MIYFIESRGMVKIGRSNDPKRRVQMLATGCPFPCRIVGLLEGDDVEETRIHEKFAAERLHGEWFNLSDRVAAFIEEHAVHLVAPPRAAVGLRPASTIINRLGGPNKVADIANVHRTRVSNWKRAKEVGGTGGIIPFKHVPALLAAAKEMGVELSTDDFLPVEKVPERENAA